MPFPVNCFVIGAQKAGTTTLASLLTTQPSICVSTPKEPLFFSKNIARGEAWYESCFEQPERPILVDASPDYSRAPTPLFPAKNSADGGVFEGIAKNIYDYNPQAKIIYILRNPISRAHSSYWHNIRAGYEEGQFSELIRSSDRYLVASDYLGQIKNYVRYFRPEQFHFILFEQLVKQPNLELQRCCKFLGCGYNEAADAGAVHKNASYQLNSIGKLARKLSGRQKNFKRFSKVLDSLLPSSAKSTLKRMSTSKIPTIAAQDHDFLWQKFSPSYDELASITGLDLSNWER